jgi:hypothetical protein
VISDPAIESFYWAVMKEKNETLELISLRNTSSINLRLSSYSLLIKFSKHFLKVYRSSPQKPQAESNYKE